jgi:hypothetical protein
LGHRKSRTRGQDEGQRSQGWPKRRVMRTGFSLVQSSLNAFDLGLIKATHGARPMQKAQALLEEAFIRFRAMRFAIGWHFRTSVE